MSETSSLRSWLHLDTLKARIDSSFWYRLADQFRLYDVAGEFSANINVVRSGVPCGPWTPSPFRYTTARVQFERVALQAVEGVQLAVDTHNQGGGIYFSRLAGAWLDIVWRCLLLSEAFLQSHKEDEVEYAWTISRVFEASAIVCTLLANQAREIELEGQTDGSTVGGLLHTQPDQHKTPKKLLEGARDRMFPKVKISKERFAEKIGIERSVFFDLQAGRPVSDETYLAASKYTGIPVDDLKPTPLPTKPTD